MAREEIILKIVQAGTTGAGATTEGITQSTATKAQEIASKKMGKSLDLSAISLNQSLEILNKIYGKLKEASPILKSTMLILEKAYKMAFKPLGDWIGTILRPLTLAMVRGAVNQEKTAKENLKSGTIIGEILGTLEKIPLFGTAVAIGETTGKKILEQVEEDNIKIKEGWIYKNVLGPTENFFIRIKEEIEKFMDDPLKWITDNVIIPTLAFFDKIKTKAKEYWEIATTWVNTYIIDPVVGLFDKIKTKAEEYWEIATTWVNTYIIDPVVGLFDKIKTKAEEYWEIATTWVNTYIIDPIVGLFDKIKTKAKEYWDIATTWIDTYIVDPVKTFFKNLWKRITSINLSDIWNVIKDKFMPKEKSSKGGSSDILKNKRASKENDFILTKSGQIIETNPNDTIFGVKDTKNIGGYSINTMNVNISVQELNSDMQIRTLANKVSEEIQRKLMYRTASGY